MNVGDLRTEDDKLVLWVQGKGEEGKDEFVVLPPKAENAVRHWLALRPGEKEGPLFVSLSRRSAGQRLSRSAIRKMALERFKAAGVVGELKSTHSLRHSAITNAIRKGATPTQAQGMAGIPISTRP